MYEQIKITMEKKISSEERDSDLQTTQIKVDKFVFEIYGLNQSDYPPLGKTLY